MSSPLDAVTVAESRPKGDVEPLVRLAQPDMVGVDALIIERMQSQVPVIPLLAEHLVSAGGKRLRPLLTVAAARASGAGGDIGAARKLAAAVEFIHTATLLHDDVVVQQGGGVDELDRGGQLARRSDVAAGARGAGRGHGQQRPQTLAARRDEVLGQQRNHRHLGLHPLDDQGVDPDHVGLRQPHQRLNVSLGAGLGDGDSVQRRTHGHGAGGGSRLKIQPPLAGRRCGAQW